MKVAIQGESGSFHHQAAVLYFGNDIEIVACKSFVDVFEELKNEKCDKAVVAIENSLYGSINEVYDLLLKYRYPIIAEVPLHIKQSLIGLPDSKIKNITHIYSHPVALAQCSEFLDEQLFTAKRVEKDDTAGSVRLISTLKNAKYSAIASEEAAYLYRLKILKRDIGNHKANYTRFLVLSTTHIANNKANKLSLVLQTTHQPGALYNTLGIFANNNINLTKLYSRPIIGKVWKYSFYIDAEGAIDNLLTAVNELEKAECTINILGYYTHSTEQ